MTDVKKISYNTDHSERGGVKSKWWLEPADEMYLHIWGVAKKIWDNQQYRAIHHLRMARLYHNMEMVSLNAGMFGRAASDNNWLSNRVTLNVVKSCVDTASAKIAKSKPRPLFLTEDGNWGMQYKAQQMTKFVDGWFDEQHIYQKMRACFVDAGVWGDGVLKIFADERDMKVKAERVVIDEIIVDDTEGRYGEPQQLHQVKLVFREVAAALWPDYAEHIWAANNGLTAQESTFAAADMIKVVESWHLPSSKDSDDGVHAIAIENCTLFHEKWEKDYFPFVFFKWCPRLLGFYGMGLAEELVGIQLEINKILRNIQIAQHLMAVPQVWLEATSHVVTAHINNEIGGIKRYMGTPPIFQVPSAMSPEIYQWLESLYKKAYEITGISQLAASAQKPAGITAAVALREMSDIASERFSLVGQRYDEFAVDISKMALDGMDDLYEKDKSISVNAADKKFMEVIKWKDIKMERDSYAVRAYPTALLPTTPEGRLQKVQELIQAGIFDRDEALSLLDYPDVESVTSMKTAPREDILRLIYLMMYKGQYYGPEPYMNLTLAKTLVQSAYNKARTNNLPEDRLSLMRNFMDDVETLLTPPPQPLPLPGPGGLPPGGLPGGPAPDAAPLTGLGSPASPANSELLPITGTGLPPPVGSMPQ